jgi:regulator of sigma E protease
MGNRGPSRSAAYVKMLDEREGAVAEAELHRAFNRQSVCGASRSSSPAPRDFLLAVVLYWGCTVHGVPGVKPWSPSAGGNARRAQPGSPPERF